MEEITIRKMLIKKGTIDYKKINIAFFLAGFTIFATLYNVQPLLTYFVQYFNINETTSSLALSISTLSLALALLLYGALSEVIGRKNIMIFSVLSVSILAFILPFSTSFHFFIFIRCVQGLFLAGLPAIAMAYLSEEIAPQDVAGAIGIYISGNALGATFGRVLTGYLAGLLGWHYSLLIMACISFFASIAFIKLLPSSKNFIAIPFNLKDLILSYKKHLLNKLLLKVFILGFLFLGCNVALFNYIGFQLMSPPYNLHKGAISFIYILFLLGMISSISSSKIEKRFGQVNSLKFAILLLISGSFITIFPLLIIKILGLSLSVFAFFMGHSIASSAVGKYTNTNKGQATSLYLLFYYVGSSVGGTLGGLLWDQANWIGVVGGVIVLMIIALIITFSISIYKKKMLIE